MVTRLRVRVPYEPLFGGCKHRLLAHLRVSLARGDGFWRTKGTPDVDAQDGGNAVIYVDCSSEKKGDTDGERKAGASVCSGPHYT